MSGANDTMLVVSLDPPSATSQGDQVYRTLAPSAALADIPGVYTVCATWLTPLAHELAEIADVLVLCQSVDIDFLSLLARRRAAGRLTVMEINDNFLDPQPHNPVAPFYNNPINRSLALQLGHAADRLQFSSEGLVGVFGHLNARHAVLTNALLPEATQLAQPAIRTPHAKPLRLGWGGSGGHLDDLRWIMPALQAVLTQRSDVTLHIMGPQILRPLFAWVPKGRLVFRPGGSLPSYQAFLSGLDVGFAPLVDTPFNRCRSDVKYMEYTMAGVPGVYSAGPAYAATVRHDETGLLANSPAAFTHEIIRLLDAPACRARLVAAAYRQIISSRTSACLTAQRLQFWADRRPDASQSPICPPILKQLPAHTRRSARHWVLPSGALEASLYDGLIHGHGPQALKCFARAARQAPRFYLPHLYMGHAEPNATKAHACLHMAYRLAPQSTAARYSLAHSYHNAGRVGAALALVGVTGADLPTDCVFAPLSELAGRLATANQQVKKAQTHYRAALVQNPWYRAPAVRLAQSYIELGKFSAARRLLEDNLHQDPTSWLEHVLLGQMACQHAAWSQARQHFEAAQKRGAPQAEVAPSLAAACLQVGDLHAARTALNTFTACGAAKT